MPDEAPAETTADAAPAELPPPTEINVPLPDAPGPLTEKDFAPAEPEPASSAPKKRAPRKKAKQAGGEA